MIRKHLQRDSRTVTNAAVSSSLAGLLVDLGGISADRIMLDPRQRSVASYTSSDEYTVLDETEKLTGGEVLPGLEIELAELFAELDRKAT